MTAIQVRVLANDTLYVLTQIGGSSYDYQVKLWQTFASYAKGGSQIANKPISSIIVDGKVKLCSVGCSECASGTCSACLDGYSYDSDTAICFVCPAGCYECDPANPNSCSSCLDGSYLDGTSCLTCDDACTTCSGTATSCQSCPNTQYFNSSTNICDNCTNNCITCSNDTSCEVCRKGFVVNPRGKCRGCSRSCSDCLATNITHCTACATYLQLVNGACEACPDRCQQCSGTSCASCDSGYHVSSDGTSCV